MNLLTNTGEEPHLFMTGSWTHNLRPLCHHPFVRRPSVLPCQIDPKRELAFSDGELVELVEGR